MINLNIVINYWDNINERQCIDKYKLFSTNTTIYVKYITFRIDEETNDEHIDISESFNFSNLDILNNFINKRFRQIKHNDTYQLNDVMFNLYKNNKVIMTDILDWEYTGFFKFKSFLDEYLNFVKHINVEHNTKLLNNFIIKNTNNTITNHLPTEIVEMILNNI